MIDQSNLAFLSGGGEAGSLIRSIDWSKTAVGSIESWPSSLRTAIRLLLDCKLPMYIAWGPEHTQFYNDAYRPILGNKHPKALGSTAPETWEEIWPTIGPMWDEVWKGQSIGFDGFKLTIERYGYPEDVYFNFSYSPVPDDEGKPAGILVTFAETTNIVLHQQKLEAAYAEAETHRKILHEFYMQSPLPMVILEGPDHVFTMVNPPYAKLFKGVAVGKKVIDSFSEEKVYPFVEILNDVYQKGIPYIGKEVFFQDLWLDFGYYPFKNHEGKIIGIFAIVHDVTPKTQTRIQIENAINEMELEKELRESFVNTLTHDLRIPLTAAKTSAQMIGRFNISPEKQTVLAGRIVDSLNRANQMIENLLDANRIKAGVNLELVRSEVGLNSLLQETLVDLETVYGNRFNLITNDHVVNGIWHAESLKRIIENLCTNAIKYGDVRTPVTITINKENRDVSISVHNEGNPISPEDQSKLFEPFRRIESTQAMARGWGLGLTLVKGLTEANGGKVSVKSCPKEGTVFTVHLQT